MPISGSLYYFEHNPAEGRDTPLILIHGAGGDSRHWPPEIRRLRGRRVLAPDLPGHGKSSGAGRQTIPAYAADLLAWLDRLEIPKVLAAGHSMGGGIVQALALHHPERLKGIILVGSGARLRVAPQILENAAQEATYPQTIAVVTEWYYSPLAPPRLRELAARRLAEVRPSVVYGDYLACNQFDVMEEIAQIALPALVLCGADDVLTPPKYSHYLAGKIRGAKLQIIPQAGHMVMVEQPQQVAAAIQDFIAGL